MKRKWVEDSEEDVSDSESTTSSKEEEKPLDRDIDQMALQLPKSIPREKALNLLHSMAASKDILYWNSHGEMTHRQRRIPLTNMIELIEYALLPYNPDVRTPRGLKTFTNGLAELGINKHLINNQKMLVDLVATQPEDTDDSEAESQSTDDHENDEVQGEDSDDDDDDDDDEGGDVGEEDDDEEEESMDEESDHDEQLEQVECHVCLEPRQFSKISIVRCPTCHWHEGHYSSSLNGVVRCDICTSMFHANSQNTKKLFYCCNDCDSIHRMSLRSGSLKLIVPQQESEEIEQTDHELDYFPSLSNWENY